MKLRFTIVLICVMLLLSLSIRLPNAKAALLPSSYQKVAETNVLALYYDQQQASIAVEDKRNGFIWTSSVGEDYYDMKDVNATWKANMKSLFNICYTDLSQDTDAVTLIGSAGQKTKIDTKFVDKGLDINYSLEDLQIDLTLQIRLDNDAMTVKIPADSIKEKDKYGITSLELLPFFGAANDYEKGYIFYPDGSGALTYFKTERAGGAERYRWYVYGPDEVNFDVYDAAKQNNLEQAMLPVFGVKIGDNAFAAIISEGEADTAINLTPSGYVVNLARISAEFTYRRLFRATRPNASLVNRIDKDMVVQDHAIRYVFLAGEQANYSGMANAYRSYLLNSGGIKRVIKAGDSIPLALDLLMAIKEDRLLFDKFIAMTTFDEARSIIDSFLNNGIKDMQVNLFGWTKGGYGAYPLHWPPSKAIGGTAGLKRLADYASKNGIKLFLQDNFMNALSQNGGFSTRKDVVYQKNGLVVTDVTKNRFLFNPTAAWNLFTNQLLPVLKRYAISGFNFEQFGELIYFDHHSDYPSTRSETVAQWNNFIDESIKQFGSAAVHGGNAYALKYADRLFDIPVNDSGYFITDETVPFYQMVVHGLIPYSSEPGNLFYDPERQKLQWVEYGYMPYYQLTYKTADLLKYTGYNQLFTSYYGEWIETATDVYQEFNRRLGSVWSQFMVDHKKLQDGVYRVTYQDGTKVYVNYNEQTVMADGQSIKALSYLVIDKDGEVK